MTRRPTTKAGIVAAVGLLLVAVGTTAQAGWLFVLSAGVLGLVASGMLGPHRLGAVTVTRSTPARTQVGETVSVEISVHNGGRKRLPVMRVDDDHPAFEAIAVACESVAPQSRATIALPRVAVRRGVFDEGETRLSTAAPFGLVRSRRRVKVAGRVIVHPVLTELGEVVLPETPAQTADEAVAATRSGYGEVFAGVREYRPGDQRRWIHWRTTARTGQLAVREHEDPAQSPVVLVVAGLEGDDAEEAVASAAASLGLHALSQARPVHCVGAGRFGDQVENATAQDVMDWAAALEPSDSTPEDGVTAAFRRWGRRCSFVLIGSEPDFGDAAAEIARRRGAGVLKVVASSAGETSEEPAA